MRYFTRETLRLLWICLATAGLAGCAILTALALLNGTANEPLGSRVLTGLSTVALLHPCTVLCRRSLVSRDPRLSSAPPGRNSRRSVRDLRLRPLGRLALPHIRSHGSRESADHDRHQRRGRNPARTGMATKRKPPRAWNCPRSHRCVRQRDRRITRIESLTRAVISRGAAALVPASVRTDRSARIAPIGRKALTEPIVRAAFGKAGASVRDLSEMRALRWQGNETDTQMLQFLPSRSVTEIVGGHPGIEARPQHVLRTSSAEDSANQDIRVEHQHISAWVSGGHAEPS